jgi:hypothetical protein
MSDASDQILASLQSQVQQLATLSEQLTPLQTNINTAQGALNSLLGDPNYQDLSAQVSALNYSIQTTATAYTNQLLQDNLSGDDSD